MNKSKNLPIIEQTQNREQNMNRTKNYNLKFPTRVGIGTATCQVTIFSPEADRGDNGKTVILVTEQDYPCLTLFPVIADMIQSREGYTWPDEIQWAVDRPAPEDTRETWQMNVRPVWTGWLRRTLVWAEAGLSRLLPGGERAQLFGRLGLPVVR